MKVALSLPQFQPSAFGIQVGLVWQLDQQRATAELECGTLVVITRAISQAQLLEAYVFCAMLIVY